MTTLIICLCLISCSLFLPDHPSILKTKKAGILSGFGGMTIILTGLLIDPVFSSFLGV